MRILKSIAWKRYLRRELVRLLGERDWSFAKSEERYLILRSTCIIILLSRKFTLGAYTLHCAGLQHWWQDETRTLLLYDRWSCSHASP